MQKAQAARLHRAADEQRLLLDRVGQVCHQRLADLVLAGTVQDQAEGAFFIVLANQDDGSVEERALQFSAIQQQLPLQRFVNLGHNPASFHQLVSRVNYFFGGQSVLLVKILGRRRADWSKLPFYAQGFHA